MLKVKAKNIFYLGFRSLVDRYKNRKIISTSVEIRRLDLLFEQYRISGWGSILAASILIYILFGAGNEIEMLVWVFSNSILLFFRGIYFNYIGNKRKAGFHNNIYYFFVLIFFILIAGMFWGIGAYLFLPDKSNVEYFVTFISIIMVICAVLMPSLASSLRCYIIFLIPVSIGLLSKIYEYEYYVLFNSVLISFLFLIALSVRLNKVIMIALHLDVENNLLVSRVELERNFAEKANLEKSNFLAAASHDLRQPLNSMGLFLYALKKRLLSLKQDRESSEIIEHLEDSYNSLKKLFDALLEVSRLDSGAVEVRNEVISLELLLRPLIEELQQEANGKNLKLIAPIFIGNVKSDPILLTRIIRNLIHNAIKYTHSGSVQIYSEKRMKPISYDERSLLVNSMQKKQVAIVVKDSGIGIPKNEFSNIFNEYHQLANKSRNRSLGIGLGLSIVKKMSRLLNSTIDVNSELGKGSTFKIWLDETSFRERSESNVINQTINIDGLKVLVVDDEKKILFAMKMLFLRWHCQVETATCYSEADDIAHYFKPDIILCDYRLKGVKNGLHTVKNIREMSKTVIPAIIITGDTHPELTESIHLQNCTLLHKPIDPYQLKERISQLVQST